MRVVGHGFLFEADVDRVFGRRRIDQDAIEFGPRYGVDNLGFFLSVEMQLGISLQIVDAPALHGNQQGFDLVKDVRVPEASRMGEEGAAWPALRKTLDLAAVAVAAEQVGGAQRCLDLAVG